MAGDKQCIRGVDVLGIDVHAIAASQHRASDSLDFM